jgi:hypothetical protein
MRAEYHPTVPPLRGAGASLTGAARVFLGPRLAAASRNFRAGFGIVGALAFIEQVGDQGLVHQSLVHGNGENGVVQLDGFYSHALLVLDLCLHDPLKLPNRTPS